MCSAGSDLPGMFHSGVISLPRNVRGLNFMWVEVGDNNLEDKIFCGGKSLLKDSHRLATRNVCFGNVDFSAQSQLPSSCIALFGGEDLLAASHLLTTLIVRFGIGYLLLAPVVLQNSCSSSNKSRSQESLELFEKSLNAEANSSSAESTELTLDSDSSQGISKQADRFKTGRLDTSCQFRQMDEIAGGGGVLTSSPRLDAKKINCKLGGIRLLMIGAGLSLFPLFKEVLIVRCIMSKHVLIMNNEARGELGL